MDYTHALTSAQVGVHALMVYATVNPDFMERIVLLPHAPISALAMGFVPRCDASVMKASQGTIVLSSVVQTTVPTMAIVTMEHATARWALVVMTAHKELVPTTVKDMESALISLVHAKMDGKVLIVL